MSKLRNLVKGQPLITKAGQCICGLRIKGGKCVHCDTSCDRILRNPKGCKRCTKNVINFVHKDYIQQEYFAIIDEVVETWVKKIREKNQGNDLPEI